MISEVILIIMMFSHDGGVHSQQITMGNYELCQLARAQVEGRVDYYKNSSTGHVKAECLISKKE